MMKKSRDTFVVRPITSRTLLITERDLSRANQLAIVPTEGSQMKGMNQASHRHILLLPESCSRARRSMRSEEHTSELQSLRHLVCRLLLEKKKEVNEATYEEM